MENKILGLHHITAIAMNAQRNYDFYTKVLGLRLVKKTVNFDDPGTYHFYYGNELGSPGTILTFFPWEGIRQGRNGTGMITEIRYAVPPRSLEFWSARFKQFGVEQEGTKKLFGEDCLSFRDPDGLKLQLVVPALPDDRAPWVTPEIQEAAAIRGFHSILLKLARKEATAAILTEVFGYELKETEGNSYRYQSSAINSANIVDIEETLQHIPGVNAGGTNHHVAFRVKDDIILMKFREKVLARGLTITEKIDRNYFYSLYFREPGGVLFELATDNPGFGIDEPVQELGRHLKLPAQYEESRKEIEQVLPVLHD